MLYTGSIILSVIIVKVTRLLICETRRTAISLAFWKLEFFLPNSLNASASGTMYCVILIVVYEVNISYKTQLKLDILKFQKALEASKNIHIFYCIVLQLLSVNR